MKRQINLSEQNLATDVNFLSRELMHDLYVVCRKAGIYSVKHPLVGKALSRPFFSFQRVFEFKKYFSLVLTEGQLFANNILMRDAGVIEYMKERMNELELTSVLFEDMMTVSDLEVFIDRFVKRVPSSSSDYFMGNFLNNRKVFSIQANGVLAEKLFATGLRYRESAAEDYSVRRIVANYFSGDVGLAVTMLSAKFEDGGNQAAATGIDYHPELVIHILPEKFAQLSSSELLAMADRILSDSAEPGSAAPDNLERLIRSLDYHPKRDEILGEIKARFADRGIEESRFMNSFSPVGALKSEVAQNVDSLCSRIYSDDFAPGLYDDFHDAFARLVRTRQLGKAAGVTEIVIDLLTADSPVSRQHAMRMLEDIINIGISATEYDFLDVITRHLQAVFTQGRETYEFSQVVITLLRTMLSLRRYEPAAALLKILKAGRRMEADVVTYDSMTIKKIFEDLDDADLIRRLVRELEQPGNNQLPAVREILTAIQSEEVALQLAQIVVHPERTVRRQCLKILSELGWPAVTIFSEILRDETNFLRPEGRHELEDEKWFLVRNTIFVLGNLSDARACNAMRLRLADPDVRVRVELVRALEKVGGDEAVDLLMIMAEDPDPAVRQQAIISLGLFRRADLVPFFADLISRRREDIARIIPAIAATGSEEGSRLLAQLLDDETRIKELASGHASVNEIRHLIVKGLERAGDRIARVKLDEYKAKLSDRNSPLTESGLGKTARLLLNKLQPKK